MSWKLPPAIKAAFDELNRRAPTRSKVSDGTVGDAVHSARRSDHNPGAGGYIHAFDITHDPAHDVDAHALVDQLRTRRDPRVKYLISCGRIAGPGSRGGGWEWKPYSGSNRHDRHAHISIRNGVENDTSPWWGPTPPPPAGLAVSGSGVPVLRTTEYPEGEDMLTRHDVHIDALDGSGNGWVELAVPAELVVSVVANGPYPPVDGYVNMPVLSRQDRGGKTVVAITEGAPNGPLDLAVWTLSR